MTPSKSKQKAKSRPPVHRSGSAPGGGARHGRSRDKGGVTSRPAQGSPPRSESRTAPSMTMTASFTPPPPADLVHNLPHPVSAIEQDSQDLHIVIDNSNVFHGAQLGDGGTIHRSVRVSIKELVRFVELGRWAHTRVVAGSMRSERIIQEWGKYDFKAVSPPHDRDLHADNVLRDQISRITSASSGHRPGILVIVSGDATTINRGRSSFHEVIRQAMDAGWKVEMCSWCRCLNPVYWDMMRQERYRGRLFIRLLDEKRSRLTFAATPLNGSAPTAPTAMIATLPPPPPPLPASMAPPPAGASAATTSAPGGSTAPPLPPAGPAHHAGLTLPPATAPHPMAHPRQYHMASPPTARPPTRMPAGGAPARMVPPATYAHSPQPPLPHQEGLRQHQHQPQSVPQQPCATPPLPHDGALTSAAHGSPPRVDIAADDALAWNVRPSVEWSPSRGTTSPPHRSTSPLYLQARAKAPPAPLCIPNHVKGGQVKPSPCAELEETKAIQSLFRTLSLAPEESPHLLSPAAVNFLADPQGAGFGNVRSSRDGMLPSNLRIDVTNTFPGVMSSAGSAPSTPVAA